MLLWPFALATLGACGRDGGPRTDPADTAGDDTAGDDTAADDDLDDDGYAEDDCDDSDSSIHPGATEVCDGIDNDCDSTVDVGAVDAAPHYADADADGYGIGKATFSCDPIAGTADNGDDCDDANGAVNPAADEVCGDDVDDDCTGLATDCPWLGDLDVADASIILEGTSEEAYLGTVVAGAGDINGDGAGDLAVSGALSSLFLGPVTSFATAGATLAPDKHSLASSYCGFAALGDQDGDGYDDLGIGACLGDVQEYVVLGPVSGAVSLRDVSSARLMGFDEAGWVFSSGDLNGDGTLDLVLGSYRIDSFMGGAFVHYGPVTTGDLTQDDADAEVLGNQADLCPYWCQASATGTVVGANGDVDGDGIDDLLVTSPGQDYKATQNGAASVYNGPVDGTYDPETADARVYTGLRNAELGSTASIGGDLDGDGLDDLAVGRSLDYYTYEVAVLSSPLEEALDVSLADATVTFDYPVYAVDTAGDLDTDGCDDLIAGMSGYYGPLSGAVKKASFTTYGWSKVSVWPQDADFVGDVSGDGIDDLAMVDVAFGRKDDFDPGLGRVYLLAGAPR